MKKFFILFALLLPCFILTSCGDDEPKINSNNLLGYWQQTRYSYVEKLNGEIEREGDVTYSSNGYAFFSDGEVLDFHIMGEHRFVNSREWSLNGNVLTIDTGITTWVYNVKVCSGTELVLERYDSELNDNGDFHEYIETDYYVRVSEQEWKALCR